jgi:hypothetical protein
MSIDKEEATIINPRASLARKHRKQRMHGDAKRMEDEDNAVKEPESISSDEIRKPHPTGIKLQARYDPGVAMTRDELTAWRKEARRVRNRESAADSRKRTRDRIEELEGEVAVLDKKYKAALARIVELEARGDSSSRSIFTPRNLSQDHALLCGDLEDSHCVTVSPCPSETSSPSLSPLASPIYTPYSLSDRNEHQERVEQKYQNIMTMISRPAESL